MADQPIKGITDPRLVIQQVAAHETGHAVVGLAIGRRLKNIERIEGRPADSYLSESIKESYATNFHVEEERIDERLLHLNAAAGMAGEASLSGKYYNEIGRDDLTRLRSAGVTETQIKDLIMLGASILQANHTFVEDVWNTILDAIERHEFDLINSTAVTNDFGVRGKKFTDLAGLERIFRLGS